MSILSIITLILLFLLTLIVGIFLGFFLGNRNRILIEDNKKIIEELSQSIPLKTNNALNEILLKTDERLTKQYTQKLEDVMKPFSGEIKKFEERVNAIHTEEVKQVSTLQNSVTHLFTMQKDFTKEAKDFTEALRGKPQMRGAWGEQILEQVLEWSGYIKGTHYQTQVSFFKENDQLKPDVIIYLPENKSIIIDSKMSLESYILYSQTQDPKEQAVHLKSIEKSIKDHAKALGGKEYSGHYQETSGSSSIDGVLMFIPIESLFLLLIDKLMHVFEYARQYKVYLSSPSNLIPLIQVVQHMWKIDQQNKNAQEIARLGTMLYEKLVGMTEALKHASQNIDRAASHLDDFQKKLEGKGGVVSIGERLNKYVRSEKQLPNELLRNSELPLELKKGEDPNEEDLTLL